MTFLDRVTSERLVKLGCKSESEFWYIGNAIYHSGECQKEKLHYDIPAFTLCDFVENTEQAKKNAILLWPDEDDAHSCRAFNARHEMIDTKDWPAYIRAALGEEKEGL